MDQIFFNLDGFHPIIKSIAARGIQVSHHRNFQGIRLNPQVGILGDQGDRKFTLHQFPCDR